MAGPRRLSISSLIMRWEKAFFTLGSLTTMCFIVWLLTISV